MMPNVKLFSHIISWKGVGSDTHVILYSRENIQWATRVWWMLKSVNFLNVSILNGGFDKWKLENKPVSKIPITYPKNNFRGNKQADFFCKKEEIINNKLKEGDNIILDVNKGNIIIK